MCVCVRRMCPHVQLNQISQCMSRLRDHRGQWLHSVPSVLKLLTVLPLMAKIGLLFGRCNYTLHESIGTGMDLSNVVWDLISNLQYCNVMFSAPTCQFTELFKSLLDIFNHIYLFPISPS